MKNSLILNQYQFLLASNTCLFYLHNTVEISLENLGMLMLSMINFKKKLLQFYNILNK